MTGQTRFATDLSQATPGTVLSSSVSIQVGFHINSWLALTCKSNFRKLQKLSMVEVLLAKCSALAVPRTSFLPAPIEFRAPIKATKCAAISKIECRDRTWSGEGEELRVGFGGASGGRNGWGRRSATELVYARRSDSVAEAPSSTSEDASNGGVLGSKDAAVDVEKRGQQGGRGRSRKEEEEDEVVEGGFKMSRICDRLIEVFMNEKTTPAQWRSLLALSEEWVRIRPHFYKRCKAKAKGETETKKKRALTKLARQVKEVDDNMILHGPLLAEIEKNGLEIDIIVAQRRKEFTGEFFDHLQTLCEATSRRNRQDELAAIAGKCLSLIEAHDAALEDTEAITEAQVTFTNILDSPSLEAAANKINELAKKKELDSTLLLLITKAWAAARDSATMKQEVKDIMYYIYKAAKTSIIKLVPDEIHIIKHLLTISDPRDRFAAMTDSFAPGDELEEKTETKFYTKPDKLRHWIKLILDAYHTNRRYTMIKEAQKLMNPEVISKLEMLLEYMDETFI